LNEKLRKVKNGNRIDISSSKAQSSDKKEELIERGKQKELYNILNQKIVK
jgi:hypothetical protein